MNDLDFFLYANVLIPLLMIVYGAYRTKKAKKLHPLLILGLLIAVPLVIFLVVTIFQYIRC